MRALARRQHHVVARRQLLDLDVSRRAIEHALARGRLHPLFRGVYAVGRAEVSRYGWWMAAVLSCGQQAVLSHETAAALWGLRSIGRREIEVSVPATVDCRRVGIRAHRREVLTGADRTSRRGIPVTSVVCTLVDIAERRGGDGIEAAINEADRLGLKAPDRLRAELESMGGRTGVAALRTALDIRTFTLTDSQLERLFLPIARRAGLPLPQTQVVVNGFRVDFYWPDLRLVVETDGLTYHRTPAQQAVDHLRDQAHAAAGLTPLRFTHAQVRYDPGHVEATLARVARRLRAERAARRR